MKVFVAVVGRLAEEDGAELDHSAALIVGQLVYDGRYKILIPRLVIVRRIETVIVIISFRRLQTFDLAEHFNRIWRYLVL